MMYVDDFYLIFLFLFFQYVNSCKNFLVQYCTDIPFGFNPISTTKCIQLVPIQYNLSIEYSVENYIIEKTSKCYNIKSYNSSSIIIFSNECRELCSDEYCLLFDNHTTRSIINIFYSSSSIYEIYNSLTNDILSYDYFLFDTCSSANKKDRVSTIIVGILIAVIIILAFAVAIKYFLSWKLRKGPNPYRPYDKFWIIDFICCRLKPQQEQQQINEPERNFNDLNSIENNNQESHTRVPWTSSTQANIILNGSSNTTNGQLNNSGNSSEPNHHNLSSENHSPIISSPHEEDYYDGNDDSEPENLSIKKKNQPIFQPLTQKLSEKASSVLSGRFNSDQYTELKSTPSIINVRL